MYGSLSLSLLQLDDSLKLMEGFIVCSRSNLPERLLAGPGRTSPPTRSPPSRRGPCRTGWSRPPRRPTSCSWTSREGLGCCSRRNPQSLRNASPGGARDGGSSQSWLSGWVKGIPRRLRSSWALPAGKSRPPRPMARRSRRRTSCCCSRCCCWRNVVALESSESPAGCCPTAPNLVPDLMGIIKKTENSSANKKTRRNGV